MDNTKFFLYLLLMAGVTYFIRAIPLILVKKKFENIFIRSFLYYVPYAVLAAMTFPVIVYSTGSICSGLIATAVGLFLALCEQSMVLVAIIACFVAYIVNLLI